MVVWLSAEPRHLAGVNYAWQSKLTRVGTPSTPRPSEGGDSVSAAAIISTGAVWLAARHIGEFSSNARMHSRETLRAGATPSSEAPTRQATWFTAYIGTKGDDAASSVAVVRRRVVTAGTSHRVLDHAGRLDSAANRLDPFTEPRFVSEGVDGIAIGATILIYATEPRSVPYFL